MLTKVFGADAASYKEAVQTVGLGLAFWAYGALTEKIMKAREHVLKIAPPATESLPSHRLPPPSGAT